MSARKNQVNLNLSGFSPIQLKSPLSIKSPVKDYGISERIEVGREKLIAGYDRWKLAETNGSQCVTIIHNLKDKARQSSESPYPSELESYCKKLEIIKTVFEDVIKGAAGFRKEIVGGISVLESMADNEELKESLKAVDQFITELIRLYKESLKLKQFVAENIAHTATSQDSQWLIASWSCDSNQNQVFKMITQLKISPPNHQWTCR